MPTWEIQDRHRFYCADDLMFFEFHGRVALADTERLYVLIESIENVYGYTLSVFDARDLTEIAAASRRYVGDKTRAHALQGATAVVGASFPVRTVVKLLVNAAGLINKTLPLVHFCATPADALEWLAGQRPHLRAAQASRRR